jgi:putative peptidoglycan lipid II flippase
LQFSSIVYASKRAGIILTFTKPKLDKDLRLMFKNMLPGIIGSSITQINLWVGTIIATNISGAVSVIYYAERLNQFPLAIIGIALGTILLPTLTRQLREKDFDKAIVTQNKALEISLFLTLPCTFALILIGKDIIHVLYERGAFTNLDTIHVSATLAYLALGLPAFVIIRIFTPRFFAALDTKTPVRISFISVTINIMLSYLLVKEFSFLGIAFSSAISGWISAILLGYFLFKKHSFYFTPKFFFKIFLILIAASFMATTLLCYKYFAYDYIHALLASKILNLFFMISCGSLSYFLVAYFLNIITISDFKR